MPSEKFYRIIDQAHRLGYRGEVCLHGSSEALCDPRFVEFVRYVKAKGMRVAENTNGDVLRENPHLCAQLDELVYRLHIGLYDYRNDEEKRKQMEFWKQRFRKTKVTFSLPQERCGIRKNAGITQPAAEAPRHLDCPCNSPSNQFVIRYDGEVLLCCEDDQCTFDLGNAFRQSLREIWWSPKHMEIARTLQRRRGRRAFEACTVCKAGQMISIGKDLTAGDRDYQK